MLYVEALTCGPKSSRDPKAGLNSPHLSSAACIGEGGTKEIGGTHAIPTHGSKLTRADAREIATPSVTGGFR